MSLDLGAKRCVDCNAIVVYDRFKRFLKCEFCGSENIEEVDRSLADKIKIDKIIPFKINEGEAIKIFEKWITKGLWEPGEVKREFRRTSAKGIYIPIRHYSFDVNTYWYGHEKKVRKQTENTATGKSKTITIEEFIPRSGSRTERYSLFVPASKGFTPGEFMRHHPFQIENAIPFSDEYLIEKQAEISCLDKNGGFLKAQEEAKTSEHEHVTTQVDRIDTFNISFSEPISTLYYVPVWIFGFKYYSEYYRIIINGITGELFGKKPTSKTKVALAIAIPSVIIIITVIYLLVR
jgi:hypothetical protein